jgi:hypothetical protein
VSVNQKTLLPPKFQLHLTQQLKEILLFYRGHCDGLGVEQVTDSGGSLQSSPIVREFT